MNLSREDLRYLADQPLGAPHLQEEAESKIGTEAPRSAELLEMCKRISKKWLPRGKKAPATGARRAEFKERQIDIEDAIEAAGGKRGG